MHRRLRRTWWRGRRRRGILVPAQSLAGVALAGGGVGRGCFRRSCARKNMRPSQGGAQREEEEMYGGGDSWGFRRSPEKRNHTGGRGGAPVMNSSGLGALGWWCLGQKEEKGEGYKREVVARPLLPAMVRIEGEESTGRRRASSRAWGRR